MKSLEFLCLTLVILLQIKSNKALSNAENKLVTHGNQNNLTNALFNAENKLVTHDNQDNSTNTLSNAENKLVTHDDQDNSTNFEDGYEKNVSA